MYRSNHKRFCTVLLLAKIVTLVRSYQQTDPPTKCQVRTFMDMKVKRFAITSTVVREKLRVAVQILGKGQLVFGPMQNGSTLPPFRTYYGNVPSQECHHSQLLSLEYEEVTNYFCTFGNR